MTMRIPLVGFANLLSGAVLVAPLLERMGVSKDKIEMARKKVDPYRNTIGMMDLSLGVISLLNRMHIIHIPFLPGGYPQSLVVIGVGLTLGYQTFRNVPRLYNFMKKVEPYEDYVGSVSILFGLHAIF